MQEIVCENIYFVLRYTIDSYIVWWKWRHRNEQYPSIYWLILVSRSFKTLQRHFWHLTIMERTGYARILPVSFVVLYSSVIDFTSVKRCSYNVLLNALDKIERKKTSMARQDWNTFPGYEWIIMCFKSLLIIIIAWDRSVTKLDTTAIKTDMIIHLQPDFTQCYSDQHCHTNSN